MINYRANVFKKESLQPVTLKGFTEIIFFVIQGLNVVWDIMTQRAVAKRQ